MDNTRLTCFILVLAEKCLLHTMTVKLMKISDITIDNGLLSFRHAEMFWHTKEKFGNTKGS